MTHHYKRNGTTTLFAALEVAQVIGECHSRHRHQEFLGKVPLHLVMDGMHNHADVWLKRHPRLVCHFVPTSSSWLNLVERWFDELTSKRIRHDSFHSVPDLKQAIDIHRGLERETKSFVRTATVESIIANLSRCRETLEQIQPSCTSPRSRKAKKSQNELSS